MRKNVFRVGGYLLMIEDDPAIQADNKKILEQHGYNVRQAFSLAQAREIIASEPPSVITLDLKLPDGSGLDFLRETRKISNVPVLILTASDTPSDIINGLEAGGDDYITKPYDINVFLVRITTLMRRASQIPDMLEIGPIRINMAANKAFLNGEDMCLTQKELSLLQQFTQYPEEIMLPSALYEKVWGQKMLGQDNSLKVAISKLRTKLFGSGYTIVASRGEGYCFERE
ncbi:MAG: response regulator transcription factor [Defluviitaleaceae bacterium]|nr:response regulator transcription factor [Defluviitaleaceae bacterium]